MAGEAKKVQLHTMGYTPNPLTRIYRMSNIIILCILLPRQIKPGTHPVSTTGKIK